MEISLVVPETMSIPDTWITVFILALLFVIGIELRRALIIIDDYSDIR